MWHWVSVLDPPTYPPMPSSLNIGHWIHKDRKVSETQKWIEVYACTLQCIGRASVGHSWTREDKSITPKVRKLVEMFTAMTGTHVPLHVVRECWPSLQESAPQQDLQEVCWMIVRRLDKVATCQPSLTAWDSFTFPQVDEEHWKEECLSYYPGMVLNIGARMPGIRLVVQNAEGQYSASAHTLMYEGHVLIYDLGRNSSEWMPMRGVSLSLTSIELRLANDLNNICPYPHCK